MSTAFDIQSVCECQALLEAELNEDRQVLRGWASFRGVRESAPATHVGSGERFDVVWECPLCGRNALRTFHLGALRRRQPAA